MMTVDDIDEKTAERAVKYVFRRAGFELMSFYSHMSSFIEVLFHVCGKWTSCLDDGKALNVYAVIPKFNAACQYIKFHRRHHLKPTSFKLALKYMLDAFDYCDVDALYMSHKALLTKKDSLCSLLIEADLSE